MLKSVFISHNHLDKPFVRKLVRDLENHGIKCWFDEAEMKIGDSLIQKINDGINNVEFFAVILSPNSIKAPWVVNELDVALNYQIGGKKLKVLPILLEECPIPGFLVGKIYGDFKNEADYLKSFKKLLDSIGVVFNKNVMTQESYSKNLYTAIDKAISINLPLMHKPFHRPFQYMGMKIEKAEQLLDVKSNEVGNIIVENEECKMLLEVEGNFVEYVEVFIKRTAPHF